MGVKLRSNLSPLEASISDGCIHVYYFDKIIKSVDLGIPKAVNIGRQCNFVNTSMGNVVAYLYGDKYRVIVRFDGTVDILSHDFILLFKSRIDIKELLIETTSICYAGSLSVLGTTAPLMLAELPTGEIFAFSDKIAVTILLDKSVPIIQDIYDWAKKHNDVGTMLIVDNSTKCSKLWVNFGTTMTYPMTGFRVLESGGTIGGIV